MTSLDHIRAHVEQWRGLGYNDAIELLDLAEQTGVRTEQAIQTYNEPMTPDMPAERMEFGDHMGDGAWVRVVGPWRPAS